MHKLRLTIALWLTIAATGVWAAPVDLMTVAYQDSDTIPDQVKMRDGTIVKPRRLPTRASSEDYTYTYKGVKYTYLMVPTMTLSHGELATTDKKVW